jgi:Protein of unknown function (DUF3551)
MTRMTIIVLFVVAAALLGETPASNAQSAYSYPWCLLGGTRGSNGLSCYYTSWEQCRATASGRGGTCVESPYYHAQPTPPPQRAAVKPHRRHARTIRVGSRERLTRERLE